MSASDSTAIIPRVPDPKDRLRVTPQDDTTSAARVSDPRVRLRVEQREIPVKDPSSPVRVEHANIAIDAELDGELKKASASRCEM